MSLAMFFMQPKHQGFGPQRGPCTYLKTAICSINISNAEMHLHIIEVSVSVSPNVTQYQKRSHIRCIDDPMVFSIEKYSVTPEITEGRQDFNTLIEMVAVVFCIIIQSAI